jgi:hypothetical protein
MEESNVLEIEGKNRLEDVVFPGKKARRKRVGGGSG